MFSFLLSLPHCFAGPRPWVFRSPVHDCTKVPNRAATVYVKAGHLFDATSDNLRDNVVLVVEGETDQKGRAGSRDFDSDRGHGGGSFEGLGAARPD